MTLSLVPDPLPLATSGHSVRVPGVLSEDIEVRSVPVDQYEIASLEVVSRSLRDLGITPATAELLDRLVNRWKAAA